MRILAVHAAPPRGLRGWIWPRRPRAFVWHAVVERTPAPTITVCGGPITAEATRTWEQAPVDSLCSECEQAIKAALRSSAEIEVQGRASAVPASTVRAVRRQGQ